MPPPTRWGKCGSEPPAWGRLGSPFVSWWEGGVDGTAHQQEKAGPPILDLAPRPRWSPQPRWAEGDLRLQRAIPALSAPHRLATKKPSVRSAVWPVLAALATDPRARLVSHTHKTVQCPGRSTAVAPAVPVSRRPPRNGRGQTGRSIGHPPPRDISPACTPALGAATLSRPFLISLARRTIDSCPNRGSHDSSRALRVEGATVLAGPAGVHAHSPRAGRRRPRGALAGQEAAGGRAGRTRPRF